MITTYKEHFFNNFLEFLILYWPLNNVDVISSVPSPLSKITGLVAKLAKIAAGMI